MQNGKKNRNCDLYFIIWSFLKDIFKSYFTGIADLTVKALENEGLSLEEARNRIWMVDIDGLLAVDRPEGGLDGHKKFYAKKHAPVKNFSAVVNEIKPSILIGKRTIYVVNTNKPHEV